VQATAVPLQAPAWHRSLVVHGLASSQVMPSGLVGFEHAPVAESQVPGAWH